MTSVAWADPDVRARGDTHHCFDHHGYLSTEERPGDYVHGWDSEGHAWTEWHTYWWRTR
jgi:hypothetical protein